LTEKEEVLVARASEGDAEAFGKLYMRHMDAIFRYVFFKLGDPVQAEDLTEEVFVRAWEALPKYQIGKSPFTSWLYRIAHNLTVDHLRKGRPEETLSESMPNRVPNPGPSPEQIVEHNQTMDALVAAVGKLDLEEQQVLLMRFVEGMSHKQVAANIGKSDGASRVIQHRALAAVAEMLREDQQPNND
jgi:RNA polymerase sigma-70 factor (ECF subfamily)